jgi:adenine-specific DNA-methyltransferase
VPAPNGADGAGAVPGVHVSVPSIIAVEFGTNFQVFGGLALSFHDIGAGNWGTDNDPRGPWRSIPWDAPEERDENLSYPIVTPKGTVRLPPKGRHWSGTEDRWNDIVSNGIAYFGQNEDGVPAYKRYLSDAGTVVPVTWWSHETSGQTDEASKELAKFGLELPFKTPKPLRLLRKIIRIATRPDSIVLDSFAGSATTAHAVLEANKNDGGYRRFVLLRWKTMLSS